MASFSEHEMLGAFGWNRASTTATTFFKAHVFLGMGTISEMNYAPCRRISQAIPDQPYA
jgi:hypothetical protein